MKFDLHSDLANQITIENLKWHRDMVAADIKKPEHAEDVEVNRQYLEALDRVLYYFCGNG
jgi:hypothetical protein